MEQKYVVLPSYHKQYQFLKLIGKYHKCKKYIKDKNSKPNNKLYYGVNNLSHRNNSKIAISG